MKIKLERPTRTESVKGFKVIREEIISDTQAIRVSQVDSSETPYPFVVEEFKKLQPTDDNYFYTKGEAYKTLEEAKQYKAS